MFTVLILAALYGAIRFGFIAVHSLSGLPRDNEDMIFF